MIFALFLACIWVFIKTVAYARYELITNNNKIGGITILLISIFILIAPSILFYLR